MRVRSKRARTDLEQLRGALQAIEKMANEMPTLLTHELIIEICKNALAQSHLESDAGEAGQG